jgi:hypothetical protein
VLFLPAGAAKPRERKSLLPLPPPIELREEEVTVPWRTS